MGLGSYLGNFLLPLKWLTRRKKCNYKEKNILDKNVADRKMLYLFAPIVTWWKLDHYIPRVINLPTLS